MKTSFLLLFTLFTFAPLRGQEYSWSTFAGKAGGPGQADGTGGKARFFEPRGIVVDGAGNLYVTDSFNSTIRKITPAGEVITLAGKAGDYGHADGAVGDARFFEPGGVAVDGNGTVYVADTWSHTIRKITLEGVVSTLAGKAGERGGEDGAGDQARFSLPSGIAADSAGNLYVADTWSHAIRKVTPEGVVSTLAGKAGERGGEDGAGDVARFDNPRGIAVDGAGNLYVADSLNHTIRKITLEGVVSTLAGRSGFLGDGDGAGVDARFNNPGGIAADGTGNLYVTDSFNGTIRKITPAGEVSTLAGGVAASGSADGTGGNARFFGPQGIAADGEGNLYVTDTNNHTIRRITPEGVVSTLAGTAGESGYADGAGGEARFNFPHGIAVDKGGTVYATEAINHTIRKITPEGKVSTLAGRPGVIGSEDGAGAEARFNSPRGIAADGAGNLYVADTNNHTIRKITPEGVVSTLAGQAGVNGGGDGAGGEARFNWPYGIAVDEDGIVYVADTYSATIRKITPGGVVSTLAGTAGFAGGADGAGGEARFFGPQGITVDGSGTVYVTDAFNHIIRKITSGGVVSTLAGTAGSPGSVDGTGDQVRFSYPSGIAVDGAGNLYVADSTNNTLRRITPGGVVSTLAGMAGVSGSEDGGAGTEVRFSGPQGVAVNGSGNVYVADTGNHSIRKGTPAALTALELWRQTRFGSPANTGAGANGSDPDGDGMTNLMEFALGLDPQAPSAASYSLTRVQDGAGGNNSLLFSCRRSTAAFDAGTVFTVEWSDDLAGPWDAEGVMEGVVFSAEEGLQNMRAVLSAGAAGRRFVRLRITAP